MFRPLACSNNYLGPVPSSPITGLPPLSDAELARSEKFSNLINVDHTDLRLVKF